MVANGVGCERKKESDETQRLGEKRGPEGGRIEEEGEGGGVT